MQNHMSGHLKSTSLRLPVDVLATLAREATTRGMTQTDFLVEALREKFERIRTGQDNSWGALADLSDKDRARTLKFIECLRSAPRSAGFRKAVDANFSWLIETQKPARKKK